MSATSQVSVFRPSRYWGSLGRFSVFIDGQQIGKVSNGQREQFDVAPGQHEITVKPGMRRTPALTFTVAPGETASFTIESVSAIAQMALSTVYLFTGKNYWLTQDKV